VDEFGCDFGLTVWYRFEFLLLRAEGWLFLARSGRGLFGYGEMIRQSKLITVRIIDLCGSNGMYRAVKLQDTGCYLSVWHNTADGARLKRFSRKTTLIYDAVAALCIKHRRLREVHVALPRSQEWLYSISSMPHKLATQAMLSSPQPSRGIQTPSLLWLGRLSMLSAENSLIPG